MVPPIRSLVKSGLTNCRPTFARGSVSPHPFPPTRSQRGTSRRASLTLHRGLCVMTSKGLTTWMSLSTRSVKRRIYQAREWGVSGGIFERFIGFLSVAVTTDGAIKSRSVFLWNFFIICQDNSLSSSCSTQRTRRNSCEIPEFFFNTWFFWYCNLYGWRVFQR